MSEEYTKEEFDGFEKALKIGFKISIAVIVSIIVVTGANAMLHNWYDYKVSILLIENAKEVANNIIDIFKR